MFDMSEQKEKQVNVEVQQHDAPQESNSNVLPMKVDNKQEIDKAVKEAVQKELSRPEMSPAWKKMLTVEKLQQLVPDATRVEIEIFQRQCEEWKLNPFLNQVHLVKHKNKPAYPVIAYNEYLKEAERSKQLAGWKVTVDNIENKSEMTATVTIHRRDWIIPFEHTVYFNEVCLRKWDGTLAASWKKQPIFMTRKVAISQAFRLCFPLDVKDLPYTDAEMPVNADEGFYSAKDQDFKVTTGKSTPNKTTTPKKTQGKKTTQQKVSTTKNAAPKKNEQKNTGQKTTPPPAKTSKEFDYKKAKDSIFDEIKKIIQRDGKGNVLQIANIVIKDHIARSPDSPLYPLKNFDDIPADKNFCTVLYRHVKLFQERSSCVPSDNPY